MEENYNGSHKGIIIILGIIFIVIVLFGGFMAYKKIMNNGEENTEERNKEVTEEKEKTETEKVEFSTEELQEYVDYIKPVSIGPSALLYGSSKVDTRELSTSNKIKYIGSMIYKEHKTSSDAQYDIISEDVVKEAMDKVYGAGNYSETMFNLGCDDYTLHKDEGKYYSKTGCGGTTTVMDSNLVINYKANQRKLAITTAYAFFDGKNNMIFKDIEMTKVVDDNKTNAIIEDPKNYLDEFIKKNYDKLNHITYTFASNDGLNYYFVGFINNKE